MWPTYVKYYSFKGVEIKLDGIHRMAKNSRDACTPQPGETIIDTMQYGRSETEKDQETFRAKSVNYIKIQIIFK